MQTFRETSTSSRRDSLKSAGATAAFIGLGAVPRSGSAFAQQNQPLGVPLSDRLKDSWKVLTF